MRVHQRLLSAILLAVAAAGASSAAGPVTAGVPPQNAKAAREARASQFSLTLLDGRRVTSTDLARKTIVLDFWGTWCPPCNVATPKLVSFANKFAVDPHFAMIGVSSDEPKDEQSLRDYVAKHRMNWMQYFDSPPRLVSQFQIEEFPTYLVIDGNGVIKERLIGWPRAAKGSTVPVGTSVIGALESAVKKSLSQGRR